MNCGDSWRREAGDGVHQALSHARKAERVGAAQLGDLVEVSACGEEMRIAGNYERGGRVVGKVFDCRRQSSDPGTGEAIRAVIGNQSQNRGGATPITCTQLFSRLDW
jgi:hypothetical protein